MNANGSGLLRATVTYPTPTASAMPCEGTVRLCRKLWLSGNATLLEASMIAGRDVRKSQGKVPALENCSREELPAGLSGLRNPEFDESLMGWPIGWTALRPLETDRWVEWLQQHSPLCAIDAAGNSERTA